MPSAKDHIPVKHAADSKDKCEIFHFSKDMLNDKLKKKKKKPD